MIESQIKISDYKDLPPHKFNKVIPPATKEQLEYVMRRKTHISLIELNLKTKHYFRSRC